MNEKVWTIVTEGDHGITAQKTYFSWIEASTRLRELEKAAAKTHGYEAYEEYELEDESGGVKFHLCESAIDTENSGIHRTLPEHLRDFSLTFILQLLLGEMNTALYHLREGDRRSRQHAITTLSAYETEAMMERVKAEREEE